MVGHEPVRCYGCRKPMRPSMYRTYLKVLGQHDGTDINELFHSMGLTRFCCRRMIMSDMSLIHDWSYLALRPEDPSIPPIPPVPLSSAPSTDPILVQFRTKGRFPKRDARIPAPKRIFRKPSKWSYVPSGIVPPRVSEIILPPSTTPSAVSSSSS